MSSQRRPELVAFGEVIRLARCHRNLSQDNLAARAGLHRTYVGGIERGERNPTLTAVVRLADALDIGVGILFSRYEQLRGWETW